LRAQTDSWRYVATLLSNLRIKEELKMFSEMILPEFEQEMANTRKTLERVPDDKFSWKPHEKSMSLGGLSTHLANIPSWTTHTFEKEELDIAPPGAPPFRLGS